MTASHLSALRKFVPSREAEEHCDTCGAALAADHHHTFDPLARRIRCSCLPCLGLRHSAFRLIPRQIRNLSDFQLDDAQWDSLLIPISLAFFSYSTPAEKWIAQYPGPAGAAESLLRLESWQEIASSNPELDNLQPDVEALLVNRVGTARDYFIVPIDECYKLVGLLRLHWRGLSGGATVWGEIAQFFNGLRQKGAACSV
jgi:hypothetical protein